MATNHTHPAPTAFLLPCTEPVVACRKPQTHLYTHIHIHLPTTHTRLLPCTSAVDACHKPQTHIYTHMATNRTQYPPLCLLSCIRSNGRLRPQSQPLPSSSARQSAPHTFRSQTTDRPWLRTGKYCRLSSRSPAVCVCVCVCLCASWWYSLLICHK
jgi:hypothetical protein